LKVITAMPVSRRIHLSAVIAGLALVAASFVTATPASASTPPSSATAFAALTFSLNTTPTVTSTGLKKHVNALKADVSPAASTVTYQWYRSGAKISGATSMDYTLTSSDYGKTVTVQIAYAKSGYTTFRQFNAPGTEAGQWWLKANPVEPQVSGDATIGGTLSIGPRTYFDVSNGNAVVTTPGLKYQWYSAGTAISSSKGGTAATYTVKSADKGKAITVKVTASGASTILPSVSTVVATPFVGTTALPNWNVSPPELNILGSSTPFATSLEPAATGIGSPNVTDNTVKYQWLRDGASIKNAVGLDYLLTTADRGHKIGVRITTSHAAIGSTTYTSAVTYSEANDYSSLPSGTPAIYTQDGPAYAVGSKIDVGLPSSVDADGNSIPGPFSVTHVWKRDGAVIPVAQGGTDQYYLLKAADVGVIMSVDATVGKVGYIPYTYTATADPTTVPRGTIVGTNSSNPTVTTNGSGDLVANAGSPGTGSTTSDGTPDATWEYQWLRNGVNIPGATNQTYTLVAADNGQNTKVRTTAVLPGYNSAGGLESTPINYSITIQSGPNHTPRVSGGNWSVGESISLLDYTFYQTKDGNIASPTVAIQWLRDGNPIPGATADPWYFVQQVDVGKELSARVTVTEPGYAPLVFETNHYHGVAGITPNTVFADVEPGATDGVLHAFVNGLYPQTPTPTYTFQWYRGTSKITGATKSTYKLTSSDYQKLISVKMTMNRPGFQGPSLPDAPNALPNPMSFPQTTGIDYSIRSTGVPALSPASPATVRVGDTVTATPPPFFESDGTTPLVDTPTLYYTWYRSGTAISGQHAATYVLKSADKGKKITVKVTASLPGRVPRMTGASNASATVKSGVFAGSFVPTIVGDSVTKKKTVTVTGTTITSPTGYTKSYVWKRSGSTVSGATSNSLTLKSTDSTKDVTVTITLKKSGYTTKTITVHVNAITSAEDVVIIGTPGVGNQLTAVAPIYYYWTDLGSDQVASNTLTYQWKVNGVVVTADPGEPAKYTPVLADQGKTVTVVVTAHAPYHFTRVDSSAAGVPIP
jgi:hypothetical protein